MPQVTDLESKKEFMPNPGWAPVIPVCVDRVCAMVKADETHLTHFTPLVTKDSDMEAETNSAES